MECLASRLFRSRERAAVAHRVRDGIARCSTRGPFRGGESESTGRAASSGMDADAFSPRLTDLPPMHGRQAPSDGSFSLGYFSFTPGIPPFALRASFAVRTRILRARGQAKVKYLGLRRRTKALAPGNTLASGARPVRS